jgi:hypothetical protein
MAAIGQVHREHPRGLSSTRAHLRCAIDLYPQISVASAGGESRPDEQLVTVLGKHLRHDPQVLIERCDVCYSPPLLQPEIPPLCVSLFQNYRRFQLKRKLFEGLFFSQRELRYKLWMEVLQLCRYP